MQPATPMFQPIQQPQMQAPVQQTYQAPVQQPVNPPAFTVDPITGQPMNPGITNIYGVN